MGVIILKDNCVGCQLCAKVCPVDAIDMVDGKAVCLDTCNLCSMCVDACMFEAIEMPEREIGTKVNVNDFSNVWVFVQMDHDGIHHVSLELVGEGRKLANELETELCCMVIGDNAEGVASELAHYEIDKIFAIDHPVLKEYRTQPYVEAAAKLIREYKPEIFLIGASSTGRDFAGGLATELETGLTADCTGLGIEVETRSLLQTRPAFGGNIMATIKSSNHRPQMATVRPKVFAMPEKGDSKSLDIVMSGIDLNEDEQTTKVLGWTPSEDAVALADADLIVAGGRGMQSEDKLELLHELADTLGGAVGASRAVVDAGWIDYSHQVGQTGRTVRPAVYVACGISGAVQHLAGMKTSDAIIAINRDREAPIFGVANYGFVGDVVELLPKVIKELKKRLG